MTFTTTPPTKPGAYWWRFSTLDVALLCQIVLLEDNRLYSRSHNGTALVSEMGGEWCGPLVPAEEVEKAYKEGWHEHLFQVTEESTLHGVRAGYEASRARRVTEGEEV